MLCRDSVIHTGGSNRCVYRTCTFNPDTAGTWHHFCGKNGKFLQGLGQNPTDHEVLLPAPLSSHTSTGNSSRRLCTSNCCIWIRAIRFTLVHLQFFAPCSCFAVLLSCSICLFAFSPHFTCFFWFCTISTFATFGCFRSRERRQQLPSQAVPVRPPDEAPDRQLVTQRC